MNYLQHYGLKEVPFSTALDDKFYFNSHEHAQSLIKLRYAVEERKGLAVLVGDLGTGKTTLARKMLDSLEESLFEAALLVVIHPAVTAQWLLRKVALQLGIENTSSDRVSLASQICHRLIEIDESGRKAVVLIDEAQMLRNKEVMEEFRGLLNVEPEGQKLLTLVLFGLVEVDACLALYKPLQQCVAVRCTLHAFSEKTTEEYIAYRLKVAGRERALFTPEAIAAVHRYAGGIPRLTNIICDNAVLDGFLQKQEIINDQIVHGVAADLNLAVGEPPDHHTKNPPTEPKSGD